jgi:hypothetical protein
MSDNTNIILGSLKFKSSPDTDLLVNVPLIQNTKEKVEYDRTIDINLEQVFDDERQSSTIFRPTCKFSVVFKNSYTGTTNYSPFENNLFYTNQTINALQQCDSGTTIAWQGFPQYNEFDFIRTDYNVSGYTKPPENHIDFISKSASTYNWNFFVSQPYENDFNKPMRGTFQKNGLPQPVTYNWVVSDGIPFIINKTTFNGRDVILFRCLVKHGLNVGEFVKLRTRVGGNLSEITYNNENLFQVDSLGDGFSDSDEYVFNILDVGFTGSTFLNGKVGNFIRVINSELLQETQSQYYVKKVKILNEVRDTTLTKAGFEINGFGINKKFESKNFTPNKQSRVSIKEGGQSYTLSFNTDIDINGMLDNQKRPISELFITAIWKGYFGYMFGIKRTPTIYSGLKQGYEFNLPLIGNNPDSWWNTQNSNSETGFPVGVYNTTVSNGSTGGPNNGPIPFTYIESLKKGDIIDGDYCEWNEFEQLERVVSKLHHKFTFNPFVFDISPTDNNQNQLGYYYQPHFSLKIRDYSDYLEEGDKQNVVGIPDYAYFSESRNVFIWRDLYSYGFIDQDGRGVNYPFLNGAHYPYDNFIFRIIPEGTNYIIQDTVGDPIIDDCE